MMALNRVLIFYIFICVTFTGINILATLYPIQVSIGTHVIFPIVAMLLFGMLTTFGYIKLSTLTMGRLLIILAALEIGDTHIEIVCLLLLQFNILEAAILDFIKKNYFNVVSALLLLGSSCYFVLHWTGSYVLVENENYLLWIVAYTVWNANFVTLQLSGAYFTHHFLILLSPIIACIFLFDFSYWLMFRETSLLLGIATLTSVKEEILPMEEQPFFSNRCNNIYQFIHTQHTQLKILIFVSVCVCIQLF
ncbi:MAG: hypothetical protein AAF617_18365, partial [Bacteroidota bacterium]